LFFTKPAIEDYLAKPTWVIEIKRLIRRGIAGLTLVELCSYCLLSKRLDHQSELLAPLSDEAQERRLEGCPLPVIVDVPDDLKKLIVDDFVSFDPRKRILALRGGFNPVTLASGCAKSAVSFFLKPAVDEYFSNLSNLLLRPLNRKLDRLLGITLVGFVGLGASNRRLSKTIAPLTEEAQERRLGLPPSRDRRRPRRPEEAGCRGQTAKEPARFGGESLLPREPGRGTGAEDPPSGRGRRHQQGLDSAAAACQAPRPDYQVQVDLGDQH
jgi:hypothetical protein